MILRTKLILTGIAIVPLTFLISRYLAPVYMELMIGALARKKYVDDYVSWLPGFRFLFFFAVAIGTYCWNIVTLYRIKRLTIHQLWIQSAIDQAVLPVSICYMTLYNNFDKGQPGLLSLLNLFAVAGVLLFKHTLIPIVVWDSAKEDSSSYSKAAWIICIVMYFIWIPLTCLPFYQDKEDCFNHLYGQYITYHTFKWIEFLYVIAGGAIFFVLITFLFKKKVAYLVFVIILAGIILMRWSAYVYCL